MVRTVGAVGVVAGVFFPLLVMAGGCQKERMGVPARMETRPPVRLALRFSAGQTATYRATTESYRSIAWVGPASDQPAGYADGRTGSHVEIAFEQRVQQVRESGHAILLITIQGLQFRGEVQNKTTLDFDSSRPEDRSHPLAALIGESYRLEMSPQGRVVAVIDAGAVRQAVEAGAPASNVAGRLFSNEAIQDRHTIPPLSALPEDAIRPGQSWSDLKSFTFGEMGVKGFERIYTLAEAPQEGGRSAVVEMKAIPSAAMAEETHKRQADNPLAGLFDNIEKYTGRLDLDLEHGRVRGYVDEMQVEWVIVDPAVLRDPTAPPRGMKMGARRLHRLELVP